MSIEFSIKKYDEERCYYNSGIDLKSLLAALYSSEHPYGALMQLDGNERIEIADYAHDEQSGKVTYSIDFDNDTIIRSEKDKQFRLNGISGMPLGAAYSLLRFHGEPLTAEFDKAFSEVRIVADTFNVVSSVRIDDNTEIVMGYRENQFGINFATWQCSDGDNYYWGHYDFPTAEAATIDMYNRVVEALQNRQQISLNEKTGVRESNQAALAAKLNLERNAYTFSLVTVDGEHYVTGAYIDSADDLAEILEQYDEAFIHDNLVCAEVSYYLIGKNGAESVNLPEEYCGDIMSHLHSALEYADLLEEKSITVDYSELEADELEE